MAAPSNSTTSTTRRSSDLERSKQKKGNPSSTSRRRSRQKPMERQRNETVLGMLWSARLCREQEPSASPEQCARAIERRAAQLNDLQHTWDNGTGQQALHDDGGW